MNCIKRLPDAEFEVMKVIWDNEPPITTNMLMEKLGKEKEWKAQTLISLLLRLIERGFLSTEKKEKERKYFPLVSKEEYLNFETANFFNRFHNNSLISLMNTLYNGKKVDEQELEELSALIKEWGE